MKDNVIKKCRRLGQIQFPVKRWEFTKCSVLLAFAFQIVLVFAVSAHSQLSILKLGKDQSAYGFGLKFTEDSRILSGML